MGNGRGETGEAFAEIAIGTGNPHLCKSRSWQ